MPKDARILVVGCGNSNFSASLFDAGWKDITSIDFSSVVVDALRKKHASTRPELKWETMDMTNLLFPEGSFDVVLDKAAMDAIMCDEGSAWDPSEETKRDAAAMCASVARVLSDRGLFLQVSFAQPHFRRRYLLGWEEGVAEGEPCSAYNWTVTQCTVGKAPAGSVPPALPNVAIIVNCERYFSRSVWPPLGEPGCLESFVYLCQLV